MTTLPGRAMEPDLPPDWTSFVGREEEIATISGLLAQTRLLTLTGPGGSGKTRLAREVVVRHGGVEESQSVAWVELAALEDPALVPRQVATAFGSSEETASPTGLADLLRDRVALVVLDNCEHLVDACAEVAHALLVHCPGIRILSTSREALGVRGERTRGVPPLGLPARGADVVTIEKAEAVCLFTDRARDAVPSFGVTEANAEVVAEICRRLDGIPLAIELAAARVKSLALAQIRDRLDDAFRVLGSAGRTSPPRHRTLRATIDWSHELLPPPTRILFRRLAVFRGGFTLDAAEEVCAGTTLAPDAILDEVARLVDRSLLGFREQDGTARYGMLETVRQYAAARLAESDEEDTVRERHAAWFADLVASSEPDFTTTRRKAAIHRLLPEVDNIREALHWTRQRDPGAHIRLVRALWWFWYSTRHWLEAGRWIHEALALPEASQPGPDRASLLFAAGALAALQAEVDQAVPLLREAASLAASAGEPRLEAHALTYLGLAWIQQGSQEGREPCERAEAWFRANGDDYGLRLALLLQGHAAFVRGEAAAAVRFNEEAVAVARRFGEDRELVMPLQTLALLHIRMGDLAAAEPLLMESFAASRRDPSYIFIATSLDFLGEARIREGRVLEAARFLGAAEAIRERIGARQYPVAGSYLVPTVARIQEGEHAEAFDRSWQAGRRLTPEQVLEEVLGQTPVIAPGVEEGMVPEPSQAESPARGEVDVADLQVQALGPLLIQVGGRTLDDHAWAYAKPRELLVYLTVYRGGRTRDEIVRALWPGASAAQGKNSFHVSLHHLRKALGGPTWIVTEGDRYRIAEEIRVSLDADHFEMEARAALQEADPAIDRLRAVRRLYRGDFLADELVGPWREEHLDRVRRLWVDLSLRIGEALEEADPLASATVYQEVAIREELNEAAHRGLMRCWIRTGERVRAVQHYDRLIDLLRDELDMEPEPETAQLGASLRSATMP